MPVPTDGSTAQLRALGRVLIEERSASVRRMAAFALGRMGSEAALDALEPARADLDRTVRRLAAAALTRRAE